MNTAASFALNLPTGSGNVEEPKNAKTYLERLADNGILRWKYGDHNTGLLLAPLLDVVGWKGDVFALTDALPVSTEVVTPQHLLGVMAGLGFTLHSERRSIDDLRAEDMPGLFVFDKPDGWLSAIVLRELGSYGLIWEDGREQHRGALHKGAKGTLYRFERTTSENGEDIDVSEERRSWLSEFVERFQPIIVRAALLSFVLHLFTLAMPLFSMVVYDRVITARAVDTLPLLTVGVVGALIVEKGIRWLRIRLSGWIGARSNLLVSAAMFERMLFLPSSVIEQAPISAQLARVKAYEAVRDFTSGPMFLALLEMPFLLILMLVIGMLAGPVVMVSFIVIGLYLVMLLALRTKWRHQGREAAQLAAQRQQMLMEIAANMKSIYATGISERMIQRFSGVSWRTSRAQYHYTVTAALVQQIAAFLTVAAGVVTIHWCLNRVWSGQMTGGAMVATMIITWRVLYPLQILCSILPHLEPVRASLRQVGQLMALKPEAHAASYAQADRALEGKISFQNVGLRYQRKSDPVFLGLNAEIQPGQIVAIYGGNGSGKSSILNLVLGLYPPTIGSIRLDDVDHRQFDPRCLRRQIGYLSQSSELLPGTVADNLRIADPLAPDFRLRQALLWADAWENVDALPAGLNTVLGDRGVVPSSGLAARLCLARIYLAERNLLLCDELPSQLLNSSTGERFRRFLEDSRGKRTVLFVTHREDWLAIADQVIWLKPDGRVVTGRPGKEIHVEKTE